MNRLGITYDTGFFSDGRSTHDEIDARVVAREMRIVRDELHCTAVRVTGGDQERLEMAAVHAAEAGLEVWYSPFTTELSSGEMLEFLADAAERAERIRREGAEVVLTTGSEVSFFMKGFFPGETFYDRLGVLTWLNPELGVLFARLSEQLNAFFADAVRVVRERFGGKVAYASLPFERIDWTPFDYVGLDLYPNKVDGTYAGASAAVRSLLGEGKPVVLTEIGCPSFAGAAAMAGHGHEIVEWDGRSVVPLSLNGDHARDEAEQADYLVGLLDLLEAEGADGAFVCTLASYHLPHRDEPRADLDASSYGIAKVLEGRDGEAFAGVPWEPKLAFGALADWYGARGGG